MKTKSTALWLAISALVSPAVFAAAEDSQSSAPMKEEKASDAATRLENAKDVLAEMRTKYRNEHPRVKEQLRKVAELERELAPKKEEKASEAATQLENAKKVLAEMRIKYRDEHPRVKEQLRKIAELERGLAPNK
jgi:uncharacterized protein involved in exopolysaccharide biosynthesis